MERPPGRIAALDGLRGVAAVIVVLHHALLVDPSLAQLVLGGPTSSSSWVHRVLASSPLHLAWAGSEAVVVFFVLSGFVLVRPYLRGRDLRPRRYLVSRCIRLYAPVWVAVALSTVVVASSTRPAWAGASPWLWARDVSPTAVLRDLALLWGPGSTNSVLWSLRWEVAFSLLLPLVLLAVRRPAWAVPLVVGLVVVGGDALRYLPIFGIGVGLALLEPHLHVVPRRFGWVALGLVIGPWCLAGGSTPPDPTAAPVLVGAGLLTACVLNGFGGRLLESAPSQWLGSRSYSLYLVHEPLLVAGASVLSLTSAAPMLALVPVALLAADVFHRRVELRTTAWSARLARRGSLDVAGSIGQGGPRDGGAVVAVGRDLPDLPAVVRRLGR